MRYKIIVQYNGKNFYGSQIQPSLRTVQGDIEHALKLQFQLNIKTYIASRTDKGVHALYQVMHFDLNHDIEPWRIKEGLNKRLKNDIKVFKCIKTKNNFHARHDVKYKTYSYKIYNKETDIFDLEKGIYLKNINFSLIKKALKLFKGRHNFQAFTTAKDEENYIRNIKKIKFRKTKNGLEIIFVAKSFLKQMIRILIGTSILYANNKITLLDITNGLTYKDRQKFNYTAPSNGLTLLHILY